MHISGDDDNDREVASDMYASGRAPREPCPSQVHMKEDDNSCVCFVEMQGLLPFHFIPEPHVSTMSGHPIFTMGQHSGRI